MTKGKKIAISLTAVFLLIAVTFIVLYFTIGENRLFYIGGNIDYEVFEPEKILTEKEVKKDRKQLIKITERTHPYFVMEDDLTAYEQNKAVFLNAEIMTAQDFAMEASRYLAFFNDVHTDVAWFNLDVTPMPDDLYYDSYQQKMMVIEEETTYELVEINGVSWTYIMEGTFSYLPLENQHTFVIMKKFAFSSGVLSRLEVPLYEGFTEYTLKDSDGNQITSVYPKEKSQPETAEMSIPSQPNFFAEVRDDGVLYIQSRLCTDDGSYNDTLNTVKQAVAAGIKNVIFDVRSNGGGSDGLMYGILDALELDYSMQAMIRRFSLTTFLRFGTLRMQGSREYAFYNGTRSNPNQLDLKVICDEYTYSAATAPVFAIKYSKLGEIVGRASGQKPNFCGNILNFQLKHSKVSYRLPISGGYWEMDGEPVGNVCDVDVFVPYGEDALDYVVFK